MNHISSVLIVGSYGTFSEELINKLDKEGWRIFTLVGGRSGAKPSRVFEQYQFDYASETIGEVIGSCRPDFILFTGAYDPLYTWEEKTQKDDSRSFIAGLNNLLMCARDLGIRHFVYLSSECVFEESYVVDLVEEAPHALGSYKSIMISQGERLASSFGQFTSMEVSIVRIADLYFIPKSNRECNDPYTRMCLHALMTGSLAINAKRIKSALYISDAVQAIFLLISAPERKHQVYHVSSEQEVSEYEIAQCIKNASAQPVAIVDQTMGVRSRTILSSRRFCEAFHFSVRVSYAEAIPQIVRFMQSHRKQFQIRKENNDPSLLGRALQTLRRFYPFFECVALFFPVFLFNSLAAGISYLQGIDFFLLFVLLFAIIRGRQLAILAFVLSVAGYCYQQIQLQSGLELLIDVRTYTWITELFLVGFAAGHLRDRLTLLEQEKDEEIQFLSGRVEDIAFINSSNTKIKNYFEAHVVNSKESIGWFYEIISQLDNADSGEVMFIASGLLSRLMGTTDVAIYTVSNRDYCRLVTATSLRARSLGKTIFMPDFDSIFQPLQNNEVYVNRSMDADLPSMANPLNGPEGDLKMCILLWDMDYEKMTLYYVNTLKVVGALIYNALIRSANYLDALAYKRYIPETKILQQFAFQEMHAIYQKAGKNRLAEFCMLEIEAGERPLEDWSIHLSGLLRESDIIGLLPNHRIGILLTNTSQEEARYVIDRMKSEGIAAGYRNDSTDS